AAQYLLRKLIQNGAHLSLKIAAPEVRLTLDKRYDARLVGDELRFPLRKPAAAGDWSWAEVGFAIASIPTLYNVTVEAERVCCTDR
ncbi:MAG: hypothetical protein ABI130_15825, partial [Leifsonia sp.]